MSPNRICDVGARGWFLPFSDQEHEVLQKIPRGLLYGVLMVYSFVGVAIVADIFMGSIETITSCRRKVYRLGKLRTERVWNETVATLSLMALGSSAPEIFLSVIEVFKNEFFVGPLGASTIVGSAAFNLLVIIAVCITAVPSSELRVVYDVPALYVTGLFSLGAYMWMATCLVGISVDVVDLWEAFATLAMMPVLLWVSYKVDIGALDPFLSKFGIRKGEEEGLTIESKATTVIAFEEELVKIEGKEEEQLLEIGVHLPDGLPEGQIVACSYRTERFSAVPGYDFEETAGTLEFSGAELRQGIDVRLLPMQPNSAARELLLILHDPVNACFHEDRDGGEDLEICTLRVVDPSTSARSARRIVDATVSINHLRHGANAYIEQFLALRYVNGSPEEQKEASWVDVAYHALALPWKLLFALVPPTAYFSGWPCFFCALMLIALLSAFLSDVAEMFGCCLEIPSIVTAVTAVALGTSMPDLFASLISATEDETADAALVNVTGSNSVNVFLGLGFPWTVSAIYWHTAGRNEEWERRYGHLHIKGNAFVVDSTNLGFSVLVFIASFFAAAILLWARRKVLGGEFGGDFKIQVASSVAMIAFWIGVVGTVSWRVLRWGKFSDMEYYVVIGGVGMVMLGFLVVPLILLCQYHRRRMVVITRAESGCSSTGDSVVNPNRGLGSRGTRRQRTCFPATSSGSFGGGTSKESSNEDADSFMDQAAPRSFLEIDKMHVGDQVGIVGRFYAGRSGTVCRIEPGEAVFVCLGAETVRFSAADVGAGILAAPDEKSVQVLSVRDIRVGDAVAVRQRYFACRSGVVRRIHEDAVFIQLGDATVRFSEADIAAGMLVIRRPLGAMETPQPSFEGTPVTPVSKDRNFIQPQVNAVAKTTV